jgi:hypothetical protein
LLENPRLQSVGTKRHNKLPADQLEDLAIGISSMDFHEAEGAQRIDNDFVKPLNELCPSRPSEVTSWYPTLRRSTRFDPGCFGFLNPLCQFGFRADHHVELLANLAGDCTGPAGADLQALMLNRESLPQILGSCHQMPGFSRFRRPARFR